MLRGAGLPHASRAQVLYNAVGKYEAERIESCLRNMFGRYHESERKLGILTKPGFRSPRDQQGWFQHRGGRVGGKGLGKNASDGGQGLGRLHPPKPGRAFLQEHANDECEPEQEYEDNEDDGNTVHFDENSVYIEQETESAAYHDECCEDADHQLEEPCEEEEADGAFQTYLAGRRAKQKAAGLKNKSGAVPPKPKSSALTATSSVTSLAPSTGSPDLGRRRSDTGAGKNDSTSPDVRKAASRCSDCGRLGHSLRARFD